MCLMYRWYVGFLNVTAYSLLFTVEEPRIATNPVDVISERGSTVKFTVKAAGYGNFTYQWYHKGTILSSQSESNLHIYNSEDEDSGSYYSRVCNQDSHCVNSSQAELTLSCKYIFK